MIMDMFPFLTAFYKQVSEDARIRATHVCLYMALVQKWNSTGGKNPFAIDRNQIMKAAKINGRNTYNRCINDLKDYGYITYTPSTGTFRQSIVNLNLLM